MPGWLLHLFYDPGKAVTSTHNPNSGGSIYDTWVVGYLGNADGGECVYIRHSQIQLVLHNEKFGKLLHDPTWYNILYTRKKGWIH